jgi:V8-like Glu-specific endopeptidase
MKKTLNNKQLFILSIYFLIASFLFESYPVLAMEISEKSSKSLKKINMDAKSSDNPNPTKKIKIEKALPQASTIQSAENQFQFNGSKLHGKSAGFDEKRELFYVGTPLSNLPKNNNNTTDYELFCKDLTTGYCEAFLPYQQAYDNNNEIALLCDNEVNDILENMNSLYHNNKVFKQGNDRREKVKKPFYQPWNAITHLEMVFSKVHSNGKMESTRYFGSGVVIKGNSGSFVLTAAHNIYDKYTGFSPIEVISYPGLKHGKTYWKGISNKYYIHPEYKKNPITKNDIALVAFGDSFSNTHKKKWNPLFDFGFAYVEEKNLINKPLIITGFPGGSLINNKICYHACKVMLTSEGNIMSITDGAMSYDIDTSAGNSGSPIYFQGEGEKFYCCGVHSGGPIKNDDKTNKGCYIDRDKYLLIKKWVQ